MNKISYIIIVFILITGFAAADDNIYIKSEKDIKINNDIKIINSDPIISDILIDNTSIYYYSNKNLYGVNKSNGEIDYKVQVSGITDFKQSDSYIYLNTNYSIYKINKSDGSIILKQYLYNVGNIYTFYGAGGSGMGEKGDKGDKGDPGINGTNGINQSDSTKVNKSGDSMTGKLNFDNNTISNIKYIYTNNTVSVYANQQLPFDFLCVSSACIPRYYSYNNDSIIGNYFVGIRFRGNSTNPLPILQNDQIFNIAGAGGYDSSGTSSSSTANILFKSIENWNTTNKGTDISFGTSANGTVVATEKMKISGSGNLQLKTAGKGIELVSPNGNVFCTTVSNLGALSTVVGACT